MKATTGLSTSVAMLAVLFSAAAAADLPRLQFGSGDVRAVSVDGKVREMIKGDVLLPGEKLVTGPGAMAQLRLFEQGVVVLRDASSLELKPRVDGRYPVALEKGLMRTVTRLGFRLGKIDVVTPAAEIAVQSGDALTGVGLDGSSRSATHSQVFDGVVNIRSGGDSKIADVGKIFQVDPTGGAITAVERAPDSMRLTLPPPSNANRGAFERGATNNAGAAFANDQTKVAVLNPAAAASAANAGARGGLRLAVPAPVAVPGKGSRGAPGAKPVFKVNFDGVKVYDPRIDSGSGQDRQTVNDALIVSIPSSISNARSFAPVTTKDPAIKKSVASEATVIRLAPTVKVAGETTLTSSQLPGVKIVTFEPDKLVATSVNFNPDLVKNIETPVKTGSGGIKTTAPIKTTTCRTCTKSLTLIRN